MGASEVISSINYSFNRAGTRFTHTGGAAQCVCDFMLSTACGVEPTANCIDVVFITDGKSNDRHHPNREVCEDILCLHNRFGVNTYAIGIADAVEAELGCISDQDNTNSLHLFNFFSFDDFIDTFEELVDILFSGAMNPQGDPYVCIDPQAGVGVQGCI